MAYTKKEALALAKPGQQVKRASIALLNEYIITGKPYDPRPWEKSTGLWAWPELWKEISPEYYEERYKAKGLGEEYDPTLPTDVPDYPSVSSLMDDLLNLRKREGRRKGRASTRVTRDDLGSLDLSTTGLFPI